MTRGEKFVLGLVILFAIYMMFHLIMANNRIGSGL